MMNESFPWIHCASLQKLFSSLNTEKDEVRVVGGAVRNTLLGKDVQDFDLASTHLPQDIKSILALEGIKTIDTGISHGTVTAVVYGKPYEITTLRRDIHTDGRFAQVRYTTSWEEDARRRDFTMNALYVDSCGRLYDYVGGLHDLRQRCVRFIGDPHERIKEDYLRILRFFRMQAYYGVLWHEPSLQAAYDLKDGMSILSGERITKECITLLDATDPWDVVKHLFKGGVWTYILGAPMDYPVFYGLSLIENRYRIKGAPLTRLRSMSCSPFPRLVLSKEQKNFLSAISLPLKDFTKKEWRESIYNFSHEITRERLLLHGARLLTREPHSYRVDEFFLHEFSSFLEDMLLPKFPVKGGDFLSYNLSGASIGRAQSLLRRWWIHQDCLPSREACLEHFERAILPQM